MEPRAHEKMRCQCASLALPVWNWAQLSILPGGKPKEQFLHVSAFNGLSVSERKNPNQDCQKIKQLLHNEFSLSDGVHLAATAIPIVLPPCWGGASKGHEETTPAPRSFQGISHGVTAVTQPSHRTCRGWELSQTKPSTLLTGEG